MSLFTKSNHNFGPGDFPRIFYDPTKELDILKLHIALPGPVLKFSRRALGVCIPRVERTEYEAIH